jgi:uncharacterized repeat protein (TIGR01451 family)
MATIENFATVRFTSGGVATTRISNLAEVGLESAVTFTKTAVGSNYNGNGIVTYILSAVNTSASPINNITVRDDLGTFVIGETTEVTPLEFISPAVLLLNGRNASGELTTDTSVAGEVTFTFPTLGAGSAANIIYNARVTEFAPLEEGSVIVNTATLESDSDCADGSVTASVTVSSSADVTVTKQMSPNPVVCGDTITYTIRVYNYGNIPAEDLVLTDTFIPAPTDITVTQDGVLLPATGYNYVDGTLTIPPTGASPLTLPAATFSRDAETGEVIVTPGMIEFVITGTI